MAPRAIRRRPISCHFCRVRKLRCSRQFPCNNCTSRGVDCKQEEPAPRGPAPHTAAAASHNEAPAEQPQQQNVSNSDILTRLEKLEALVSTQAKELQSSRKQTFATSSSSTPRGPSVLPPKVQRLTADALELERASRAGQTLKECLVSDTFVFQTSRVDEIIRPSTFSILSFDQSDIVRCVRLPLREESHVILDSFFNGPAHFLPYTHGPSIRQDVEDVYHALASQNPVDLGKAGLLLAICAGVTQSCLPGDRLSTLFASAVEANARSVAWMKATMDVIDTAERSAHVSLPCLQAIVTAMLVMCLYEGASLRPRALSYRALAMARELGIHRLDDPNSPEGSDIIRKSVVKTEIARRMWWNIVTIDWMCANLSSPQSRTYAIHPNHMAVHKPRNVLDKDLCDGREVIEQSMDCPTNASYLLQRIELAEIGRKAIDRYPIGAAKDDEDAYDRVLEADESLRSFVRNTPWFLTFDHPRTKISGSVDTEIYASVTAQRCSLALLVQRQLVEIHLPYFTRAAVDARFAPSREACVACAKKIMSIHRQMQQEEYACVPAGQRLILISRTVFMAVIALTLNACLKDDPSAETAHDSDLIDSLRLFHDLRNQSVMAGKLLEGCLRVLRNHNVTIPALEIVSKATLAAPNCLLPPTPESGFAQDQSMQQMSSTQPAAPEMATAADYGQWQGLEDVASLDGIDWEALFGGLDARIL